MSQKRCLLLLVASLTIALAGEPQAAEKLTAAGALKILDLGTTTTPIFGFDFSALAIADFSGGSGGGAGGKTTFNAIGITRISDAISVDLFETIAKGQHLKRVEIAIFTPGTTTVDATYGLSDAVITSLKSGPGTEFVAFSYAQIDITSGGKTFCFNTLTNAEC